MEPAVTGQRYDGIAERWRDGSHYPNLPVNGIAAFERAIRFVKGRGPALDVGCGCNGRFIDLLRKHGFAPEGVDVSTRMVALARERHPDVAIHHADVVTWPLPRRYAFVSAWDSTWHLPLESQEPVLRKLCAGLEPGGVLIFTTAGSDGSVSHNSDAMGPEVHYSALGIARTLAVLEAGGCACRHLEYDQYPELHLYIIAQKAEPRNDS